MSEAPIVWVGFQETIGGSWDCSVQECWVGSLATTGEQLVEVDCSYGSRVRFSAEWSSSSFSIGCFLWWCIVLSSVRDCAFPSTRTRHLEQCQNRISLLPLWRVQRWLIIPSATPVVKVMFLSGQVLAQTQLQNWHLLGRGGEIRITLSPSSWVSPFFISKATSQPPNCSYPLPHFVKEKMVSTKGDHCIPLRQLCSYVTHSGRFS